MFKLIMLLKQLFGLQAQPTVQGAYQKMVKEIDLIEKMANEEIKSAASALATADAKRKKVCVKVGEQTAEFERKAAEKKAELERKAAEKAERFQAKCDSKVNAIEFKINGINNNIECQKKELEAAAQAREGFKNLFGIK